MKKFYIGLVLLVVAGVALLFLKEYEGRYAVAAVTFVPGIGTMLIGALEKYAKNFSSKTNGHISQALTG